MAASRLDQIVRDVTAAHPTCGDLNDLLAIATSSPDADVQLERALGATDAGLVQRLARTFGADASFERASLARAIQELGVRSVHSAAVANAVVRALGRVPSHHLNAVAFWRNATAVAVLTLLSATTDGSHYDEAFAAGFLHRVGLLLLDQYAPAGFGRSVEHARREQTALDDALLDEFGFSPPELAGAVTLRWNLPQWLTESCAYPASIDDVLNQPRRLSSLVTRARMAAAVRGFGAEFEAHSAAESGATWLVERPLLALDRVGGEPWLLRRVDAMVGATLFAR